MDEERVALAATGAYGLTDTVGDVEGSHHRVVGSLAAAVTPVPWLTAGLRLDGRWDLHPDDGMGPHSRVAGDPRLLLRLGQAASQDVQLGAELGVWVPGKDAPSLALDATTLDLRALASYLPTGQSWGLLGMAGFRWDNSARAAPQLERLRPGDRVSLGLSEHNALLLAAGCTFALGATQALFLELSADLLLGAPRLTHSPLRASLGLRKRLAPVELEASLTAVVSRRPQVSAQDPVTPIEPRVLLTLGLRFGTPLRQPAPEPPAPRAPTTHADPVLATTTVQGQLVDGDQQPLMEALVRLRASDGGQHETISDAQGRFRFEGIPVGPVEMSAEADGFEGQRWQLEATLRMQPLSTRALQPRPPAGVLRGLARSFDSEPLQATVRVFDGQGRSLAHTRADDQGRFELSVAPGQYQVRIQAPGYRSHRRRVRISENSVTILNVDLQERKR